MSLFDELKQLGVDDEEGLFVFSVRFGDDGWNTYNRRIEQLSNSDSYLIVYFMHYFLLQQRFKKLRFCIMQFRFFQL
jgi:hypothetical protein